MTPGGLDSTLFTISHGTQDVSSKDDTKEYYDEPHECLQLQGIKRRLISLGLSQCAEEIALLEIKMREASDCCNKNKKMCSALLDTMTRSVSFWNEHIKTKGNFCTLVDSMFYVVSDIRNQNSIILEPHERYRKLVYLQRKLPRDTRAFGEVSLCISFLENDCRFQQYINACDMIDHIKKITSCMLHTHQTMK